MDTIDNNVMQAAAEHVIHTAGECPTIHTVIVELNGQHGGADVIIQGEIDGNGMSGWHEFEQKFEVH